jgi:hypothetical protein
MDIMVRRIKYGCDRIGHKYAGVLKVMNISKDAALAPQLPVVNLLNTVHLWLHQKA